MQNTAIYSVYRQDIKEPINSISEPIAVYFTDTKEIIVADNDGRMLDPMTLDRKDKNFRCKTRRMGILNSMNGESKIVNITGFSQFSYEEYKKISEKRRECIRKFWIKYHEISAENDISQVVKNTALLEAERNVPSLLETFAAQ